MLSSRQISESLKTESIEAAITFLLNARNEQGWWTDFLLAPGFSDEWVTGYVGTMLSTLSDYRVAEAVNNAWNLLCTRCQRPTGAWGYNRLTPGDADSTGWGLQLAHAVGQEASARACRARNALIAHLRSDGSISTYATDEPIRTFIGASPNQSFAGWCGSHTCVSAAIATLPEYRLQVGHYLKNNQSPDGCWRSYWWRDHEYTTALAAEAISTCNQLANPAYVLRAVKWGMQRLSTQGFVSTTDHQQGSPFATAWCLRLLLLNQENPDVGKAIETATNWLLEQQEADGSWQSSARLLVPYPDDQAPEEFDAWIYHGRIQGSLIFDYQRVFTTATILKVLSRV